jgi:hypothetical protein
LSAGEKSIPGTNVQPAIDPNKKSAVLQNSLLALGESVRGESYATGIARKYCALLSLKTIGRGKIGAALGLSME